MTVTKVSVKILGLFLKVLAHRVIIPEEEELLPDHIKIFQLASPVFFVLSEIPVLLKYLSITAFHEFLVIWIYR